MIWGVWLGVLTVIQLAIKDHPRRVVHTLGDCVFWIGASYLLEMISIGTLSFGSFVALLIVTTGLSLITRAIAILILEKLRPWS